jgi:glycosyltransferase involved in cell wall biosynthesis
MKILQIANKFPYPSKDGGSIATLSFSRSLAELGHDVTLLAMNTSKHYTDLQTVPQELKEAIRMIAVPVDTTIRPAKLAMNFLLSRIPYNAERFISKPFADKLRQVLGEQDFDIVQLEGLYVAPYLDMIRSGSRAKVVMRAHNVEHEIWERTSKQQGGLRGIYLKNLASRIKRMEEDYLNRYDAVLPITGRDGEILKKMGCHLPMHVVPTGIDTRELKPDHSEMEFPSVFHIGALDWSPNLEGLQWFFSRVWPQVLEKHPALQFFLAGRNAPESISRAQHSNVTFLGEVEDAYDFMRKKAVMIVPILSGSGMRIKIVEGMALGKTIVTTTIGTEGISTTDGKNILVADTPEKFAAAVCELVENRELFRKIGENACTFVRENYDNLSITDSCVGFFQKLK